MRRDKQLMRCGVATTTSGDPALINAYSAGNDSALTTLAARHNHAVFAYAKALAPKDAKDLARAAIAAVGAGVRGGTGPAAAFRLHALTTTRTLTGDLTQTHPHTSAAGLAAFGHLCELHQLALWHRDVDAEPWDVIALLVGTTISGAQQLHRRARWEWRVQTCRIAAANSVGGACIQHAVALAGMVAGSLDPLAQTVTREHLHACEHCWETLQGITAAKVALRHGVSHHVLGNAAEQYLANLRRSAAALPPSRLVAPAPSERPLDLPPPQRLDLSSADTAQIPIVAARPVTTDRTLRVVQAPAPAESMRVDEAAVLDATQTLAGADTAAIAVVTPTVGTTLATRAVTSPSRELTPAAHIVRDPGDFARQQPTQTAIVPGLINAAPDVTPVPSARRRPMYAGLSVAAVAAVALSGSFFFAAAEPGAREIVASATGVVAEPAEPMSAAYSAPRFEPVERAIPVYPGPGIDVDEDSFFAAQAAAAGLVTPEQVEELAAAEAEMLLGGAAAPQTVEDGGNATIVAAQAPETAVPASSIGEATAPQDPGDPAATPDPAPTAIGGLVPAGGATDDPAQNPADGEAPEDAAAPGAPSEPVAPVENTDPAPGEPAAAPTN